MPAAKTSFLSQKLTPVIFAGSMITADPGRKVLRPAARVFLRPRKARGTIMASEAHATGIFAVLQPARQQRLPKYFPNYPVSCFLIAPPIAGLMSKIYE
jgi:hypothetical protein